MSQPSVKVGLTVKVIEAINAYGPYSLASFADCASPDSNESTGAQFLNRVRDGIVESVEYVMGKDRLSLVEAVEEVRNVGADHEVCDGAVPIHTYLKWATFADLCAYQEDLDELGGASNDMDTNAGMCLYLIASRLVSLLLDQMEEGAPKYVATVNITGYLPMDDEPPVFDSIKGAWEYLADEREAYENDTDAEYYSSTLDELREMTTVGSVWGETPDYDGGHDLGLLYTVTEVDDDDQLDDAGTGHGAYEYRSGH